MPARGSDKIMPFQEFMSLDKSYCDRCGVRKHRREIKRDPTGFYVCPSCWLEKERGHINLLGGNGDANRSL